MTVSASAVCFMDVVSDVCVLGNDVTITQVVSPREEGWYWSVSSDVKDELLVGQWLEGVLGMR